MAVVRNDTTAPVVVSRSGLTLAAGAALDVDPRDVEVQRAVYRGALTVLTGSVAPPPEVPDANPLVGLGRVTSWADLQGTITLDAAVERLAPYLDGGTGATPGTVGDATADRAGVIRLAGDLGGLASAPTVPRLADLLDAVAALQAGLSFAHARIDALRETPVQPDPTDPGQTQTSTPGRTPARAGARL